MGYEVSMHGPLDFVKSIQDAKKAQSLWAHIPAEERLKLLEAVQSKIQSLKETHSASLAKVQGLQTNFVKENDFISIPLKLSDRIALPTGMISILLPYRLSLRFLLQKALPALLAGNGLFIKTSEENTVSGEIFKEATKDLPPHLIHIFNGKEDLGELLVSHPGVHAVAAMGRGETMDRILKASIPTYKKLQLHGDFHNSALILNEANLEEVIPKLVDSAFTGMGMLRYNVNNVLVLESMQAEFEERLVNEMEKRTWDSISDKEALHSRDLQKVALGENGKAIFQSKNSDVAPLVIRDMSHCSTLQSDCLHAPILLISPVKYAHEMVKWTNTSSYGELAQIFGPSEKILKFGSQLEVANVVGSDWISGKLLAPGHKQSFYGRPDEAPFGQFFSNPKVVG